MLTRENENGGPTPPTEVIPNFSLRDYLLEVGKAIRTGLPTRAWVDAVILDARQTRSGLNLELVEAFADDRNNGRMRCVLWANTKSTIEAEIGIPLDAATIKGVQARLLLKPNFHPKFHLEGEVLDLDRHLIESLMARRMEAIRKALRGENLYGAQQRLELPADVCCVAVIHPDRSAGWADVRMELERLQSAGILVVQSYATPFEGAGSAEGIAAALGRIGSGDKLPDMVLIIRGGGAASGFASLVNLSLARAICQCPIPVVTGVGHASDRTVIDEVAWRAADTPSKALGVVKSILRQRCIAVTGDHKAIIAAMDRLTTSTLSPLLAASRSALVDVAERFTAREAGRLREVTRGLERHLLACRGDIELTRAALTQAITVLLDAAPRLPRAATAESTVLYVGILDITRSMLPSGEALKGDAKRSAGLVGALIKRQESELRAIRSELESSARRAVSEEGLRLSASYAAAEILDVVAVLKRGFALPLDQQRQIIRSAETARAADCFELLIADGSVACRPVKV